MLKWNSLSAQRRASMWIVMDGSKTRYLALRLSVSTRIWSAWHLINQCLCWKKVCSILTLGHYVGESGSVAKVHLSAGARTKFDEVLGARSRTVPIRTWWLGESSALLVPYFMAVLCRTPHIAIISSHVESIDILTSEGSGRQWRRQGRFILI